MTVSFSVWPRSLAVLGVLAVALVPVGADAADTDWPTAVNRARTATCDVLIDGRHFGTSFLVAPEGLAITAAHVVATNGRIELMETNGDRTPAEVLARDLGHDLALLRLEGRDREWPHLEIAVAEPAVGDDLALLGTPLHRRQMALFGRVASDDLGYEYLGDRTQYVACRYVSGLGPKGTSGGPWLDREGRVVGMQIGGMSLASGWQGISYTAPTAAIRRLLKGKRNVPAPTIRLVVEETWQQTAEGLKAVPPATVGLFAKVFDENGPAAKAGIETDDVLLTIDGKPLRFAADLVRHVRSKKIGDRVEIEILGPKGGKNRRVQVQVAGLVEGRAEGEEAKEKK